MLQKIKPQRARENDYPAEIAALIELLPTIRNVAHELQECSDAISRRFHIKGGTANASENIALSLKLLLPKVADHKEYANFLQSQGELYDKIGNLQRTLYTEIQDKVTNPLKSWLMSDYGRIMSSIELLKTKRWQLDSAVAEFEKLSTKKTTVIDPTAENFRIEQFKKEYETQLALVKADLNKIPAIQIDQAICLKNFNDLMYNYHRQMEEVLEKYGAGKV